MKYFDTQLEFTGATLLSVDEAMCYLSKEERKYKDSWWLRNPGNYIHSACYVYSGGNVYYSGNLVYYHSIIRPVLIISDLGDFKVGDIFSIGEYYFKIINPKLAWMYMQDIGEDYFDDKSNNYETSHVKEIVDSWFEKLKDEMI